MPNLSRDLATYWDLQSFLAVAGLGMLTDALSFLPVGAVVNGRRMNGKRGWHSFFFEAFFHIVKNCRDSKRK